MSEIDEALEMIEKDTNEIAETNKEVAVAKPDYSIDDLIGVALDSYGDIQQKSEQIFNCFYDVVATRQDRSDASKMMLTDSQRLKIESINALANLANAKAKLISAQQKQSQVGIFVNAKSGEDVGINLANLQD